MTQPRELDLTDEQLVRRLAEQDAGGADEPDSTVKALGDELATLADSIRDPATENPFEAESACRRVNELVREIGRPPAVVEKAPAAAKSEVAQDLGRLGHYQLLAKLGEGGRGAVYKALHTRLDKLVALKVLPKEKLEDQAALARFDREMRAVGKLEHPNIVRAMDAGDVDGTHYLVMEIVDGEEVGAIVRRRGPLPIPEACEIIRQAALGLQHAHEHGLVHRDIKPSNLMVTFGGGPRDKGPGSTATALSLDPRPSTVKILDMGLALLEDVHVDARELTSTGQIMGTLDYMAPEQGSDTHSVDIRADVYSLGATLYRMLTGRAPFDTPELRSPIKKLMALANTEPQPIGELRSDIPPALARLVHRMLSKSPDGRPTPPAVVAEELTPFAYGADLSRLFAGSDSMGFVLQSDPAAVTSQSVDAAVATAELAPQSMVDSPTVLASGAMKDIPVTVTRATLVAAGAPGQGAGNPRSRNRLWTAIAGLAATILLGVVIIVQTDMGEVVIDVDPSIAEQVQLTIKRDGAVALDELTIEPGTRESKHRIRSGQIEVELPAELQDRFVVSPVNGSTELVRSGKVVFALRPAPVASPPAVPGSTPASSKFPALAFNGTSDFVEVSTLALTDDQPITIETWLTCNAPREASNPVAIYGSHQMVLYQTGGDWGVAKKNGDESILRRAPGSLKLGERTHLAGVWDGQQLTLFINGRKAVVQPQGYQLGDSQGGLYLGGAPADKLPQGETDRWFNGEIEQVRVTRGARYAADFTPAPVLQPEDDSLAVYAMNENRGDTIADATGQGHVGKIVGATWVRLESVPPASEAEHLGPIVNSGQHDGGPSLSADGLTLIFQSNRPGGQGGRDLWVTSRDALDDAWSPPRNLGPNINSAFDDENACLSPDGLQLHFDSIRPGGLGEQDIWVATRPNRSAAWEPAVNLGGNVNAKGYDGSPCLSTDGLTLMLTSEPGAFSGTTDQWICTRPTTDAPWSPRSKLAGPLNSPAFDGFASLSADGLVVVFNSNRDGEPWPGPVWKSTRTSPEAEWSAPVRLLADDQLSMWSPELSSDGHALLFDSKRPGGVGGNDLWSVRLPESPHRSAAAQGTEFALEFSGESYVEVPDFPPRGDGPVTVEAIVRVDNPTAHGPLVIAQGTTLYFYEDYAGFHAKEKSRGYWVSTDQSLQELGPQFLHVAGVWDGTMVRSYLNGRELRRKSRDSGIPGGWQRPGLWIGRNVEGQPDDRFVGQIKSVRISSAVRYTGDFVPPQPGHRWTPDNETLALYRFDEGEGDILRDASGHGHHGTIVGATWVAPSPASAATALPTAALAFNGRDAYVEIPGLTYDGSYPITLEARVVPRQRLMDNRSTYVLGNISDRTRQGGLVLRQFAGGWRGTVFTEVGQPAYPTAADDSLDPANLALVYDLEETRLYVNGRLMQAVKTGPAQHLPSEGPFVIGGPAGRKDSTYFDGVIDEIRISNVARYDADYAPVARFEPDEQTLALYHCDEGSGDRLHDISGHGHDGAIVGAKWVSLDRDRRAAEHILSVGGVVRINGEARDILDVGELPEEPFRLTFVGCWHNEQVNDAGLVALAGCRDLIELHLEGASNVTDAGLAPLEGIRSLRVLNLFQTPITDVGLSLFRDCNDLTWLQTGGTQCTEAGLAQFQDCRELEFLGVIGCTVTDAGLAGFGKCEHLQRLHFEKTAITDAGLAHFQHLRNLNELDVERTEVTDAGVGLFLGQEQLTSLDVRQSKVSEEMARRFHEAHPQCRVIWDGGVYEPVQRENGN